MCTGSALIVLTLLAKAAEVETDDAIAIPTLTPFDLELDAPSPQLRSPRSKRAIEERKQRGGGTRSSGGKVQVPIDIGVGPVGLVGLNSLVLDQPLHAGLALSIAGVIDRELILRYQNRIPAAYRDMAKSVDTVYVSPWWLALVPETFVISPAIWNTGMYGAIWRVLGLGLPLKLGPATLTAGAKLSLCYLFVHSSTLPTPTHFVRPGVHLHATLLVPFTETFLLSAGWASDLFIPQPLGQPPWTVLPLDDALWHLGGPFIKLHVRVPMEVAL